MFISRRLRVDLVDGGSGTPYYQQWSVAICVFIELSIFWQINLPKPMKNKNSLQNVHKWYTNERYTGHYNKQKHEKGIVLDYTTCTWKEISKFFVEI